MDYLYGHILRENGGSFCGSIEKLEDYNLCEECRITRIKELKSKLSFTKKCSNFILGIREGWFEEWFGIYVLTVKKDIRVVFDSLVTI